VRRRIARIVNLRSVDAFSVRVEIIDRHLVRSTEAEDAIAHTTATTISLVLRLVTVKEVGLHANSSSVLSTRRFRCSGVTDDEIVKVRISMMLLSMMMATNIGRDLILNEQRLQVLDKVSAITRKRIDLMMANDDGPLSFACFERRLDPSKLFRIALFELIEGSGIDHNEVQFISVRANLKSFLVIERREGPSRALLRVIELSLNATFVIVVSSDDVPLLMEELLLVDIFKDGLPFRIIYRSNSVEVEVITNGAGEVGLGML